MINICICDDNAKHSSQLEQYISDYLGKIMHIEYNIDIFESGENLIRSLKVNEVNYQIMFLDIEMEGINGIEAATFIRKSDRDMLIIYVTSYDKYTLDSFTVSPFRYLLKPIEREQFEEILSLAINEVMMNNQFLFFKFQNVQYQIKYDHIKSITSESGRLVIVKTIDKKGKYLFYGKLKDLEKQLNPLIFIRISSGVFVNFNFIHIISGMEIHMDDGEIYTISRSKNKLVKYAYNEFLKRKLGV